MPDIARFVDGLEEALQYGGSTHTVGDVLNLVLAGRAQLWMNDGAAVVSEIHDLPRAKVLHIWLATGRMRDVIFLAEQARDWGKELGCTQVTLAGRRGWQRVLAHKGMTPRLVVMGMEI